ncbi:MAG: hypothetical protein ABW352_24800 [Polyangiales bacterium]
MIASWTFSALLTTNVAHATANQCRTMQANLLALGSAFEVYLATDGRTPPASGWLEALGLPEHDRYDTWANPYVYERLSDAAFSFRSVGADGVMGTRDDQILGDPTNFQRCEAVSWWVIYFRRQLIKLGWR